MSPTTTRSWPTPDGVVPCALTLPQNSYVPGGSARALSMDSTGRLYAPPTCAYGAPCTLVVALHGCLSAQQLLGTAFAEKGNLDTNNLVVLYPQAVWFGSTGSDYAVRSAPQMTARGRTPWLLTRRVQRGRSPIRSAAFSAIMIVGAFVFPLMTVGMTEASTTRSRSTPWTSRSELTTELSPAPMAQVPTG